MGNQCCAPLNQPLEKEEVTLGKYQYSESSDGESTNEEEYKKRTSGEFLISKDLFVNLKKGSIQDNYKIGESLGQGAYGMVNRVIHKKTSMIRAMKTIKKQSIQVKNQENKLFEEMNVLKNLDHPNILRLYELYEDKESYYLLTEYCAGGELFDKIKSLTTFTERMAADYMKQILSALVYLHSNNICHRDLKPENLIFDTDQKTAILKVIDFGTSKKLKKKERMDRKLGTPYYIAPEVLNQDYDKKCDVWSCGVILYIMLCGYPPFSGNTEQDIFNRVKKQRLKFDEEDWHGISEESKNIISQMLQKDPKKRPSAKQCLSDHWIQLNAPKTQVPTKALQNLINFQTKSKLKQAVFTFIVSQVISQQDKYELEKAFFSLDKNGDGQLCKEELIEGYFKVYGDKQKAIQLVGEIMEVVDINKSDQIDFSEFLMAAMSKDIVIQKYRIEQAFTLFDQNGDGFIDKEEFEQIIGQIQDKDWQELLQDCDQNKIGKISKNEFIELLTNERSDVDISTTTIHK